MCTYIFTQKCIVRPHRSFSSTQLIMLCAVCYVLMFRRFESFVLNLLSAVYRMTTSRPDHGRWHSLQRSNHCSCQRGPAPRASRGVWACPDRVQGVDGGVLAHLRRGTSWLWRRRQGDRRDSKAPGAPRHSRIADVICAVELKVTGLGRMLDGLPISI